MIWTLTTVMLVRNWNELAVVMLLLGVGRVVELCRPLGVGTG